MSPKKEKGGAKEKKFKPSVRVPPLPLWEVDVNISKFLQTGLKLENRGNERRLRNGTGWQTLKRCGWEGFWHFRFFFFVFHCKFKVPKAMDRPGNRTA